VRMQRGGERVRGGRVGQIHGQPFMDFMDFLSAHMGKAQ